MNENSGKSPQSTKRLGKGRIIRAFRGWTSSLSRKSKGSHVHRRCTSRTGFAGNIFTFIRDGLFLMRNSCPCRVSGKFLSRYKPERTVIHTWGQKLFFVFLVFLFLFCLWTRRRKLLLPVTFWWAKDVCPPEAGCWFLLTKTSLSPVCIVLLCHLS